MNKNPLISIVVPAYNTKDVIKNTFKSIEQQTYRNYQIIVIDDGSTDGTGELIDNYDFSNNQFIIYHQENKGVSAARNKGIELAKGELICFLDSDDTYEPNFLEKMLSRQQQKDANIVYCGFSRIKQNSIINEKIIFNEGNVVRQFLQKPFHMSAVIYKRSFLIDNNILFDTDLTICEDIFFTLKALVKSDAFVVKDYLFNYIYRNDSVTNAITNIKLYSNDINTWSRVIFYLRQNYHKDDQLDVMQLAKLIVIKLKIKLLIEYLKNFNYNMIRNYLHKDSDFAYEIKTINNETLRKSDRKKISIIKSNNLIIWFLGSLYYRYIRRNSGK